MVCLDVSELIRLCYARPVVRVCLINCHFDTITHLIGISALDTVKVEKPSPDMGWGNQKGNNSWNTSWNNNSSGFNGYKGGKSDDWSRCSGGKGGNASGGNLLNGLVNFVETIETQQKAVACIRGLITGQSTPVPGSSTLPGLNAVGSSNGLAGTLTQG